MSGQGDNDGDIDLVGTHTVFGTRFHGESGGSKVQVGTGTPGEGGSIPLLGKIGPLRPGKVTSLSLTGVPAPAVALLGISLGESTIPNFPAPGMTFRLDPATTIVFPIAVAGNSDGRGAGSALLPSILPQSMAGIRLYLQAVVIDTKAQNGATITNMLREHIGR